MAIIYGSTLRDVIKNTKLTLSHCFVDRNSWYIFIIVREIEVKSTHVFKKPTCINKQSTQIFLYINVALPLRVVLAHMTLHHVYAGTTGVK